MILTAGKQNVLKLLAGNTGGKAIVTISAGTSGTAATEADTTITASVDCTVTTVEYLPGDIERYTAILDAAVPAFTIRELGLKDEDGTLLHRKVISPSYDKASGLTYTLQYEIKVI
jgi:phage-related tail fiber protein